MKIKLITALVWSLAFASYASNAVELAHWKFKTGDNLEWAQPEYDESGWQAIAIGRSFESQGHEGHDGYVWYRVKFVLPASLKSPAFPAMLQIHLGKVDDCSQVFLNGKYLGQNGSLAADATDDVPDLSKSRSACDVDTSYAVAMDDARWRWGAENVLAVRVHDFGGSGGMFSTTTAIQRSEFRDCLVLNADAKPLESMPDGLARKTIAIKNISALPEIQGELTLQIVDADNQAVVTRQSYPVKLAREVELAPTISFKHDLSRRMQLTATFVEATTQSKLTRCLDFPYILTPKPAETPQINGAKVVGVRPGSPFIYRIPATGIRPMTFSAENLPAGLTLDASTGVILGKLEPAGEHQVTLRAANAKGAAHRALKIVVGNRIALTPPMGWNGWNCYFMEIDEEKVRNTVEVMLKTGLANYGWNYVNIDDGWEGPERDAQGRIVPESPKFKDFKALTDFIHSHGFKAGIYSSPGPKTCGSRIASYQYEAIDAQAYADWGFDYLKYDWCSYSQINPNPTLEQFKEVLRKMSDGLRKANRDIVFSFNVGGAFDVWKWGDSVGGNVWRTTGDLIPTWESLKHIGFNQEAGAPYAKPGNWNDPDMLIVGTVFHGDLRISPNEQYTQMSLWSLLSAPLLMGCDMAKLDEFTLSLLSNSEVIDIDQDPLGKQAVTVAKTEDGQIYVKELEDGSKAVGLFNLSESDQTMSVNWPALGVSGNHQVRDVWRQKDLGTFSEKFESLVPSHGVVLVKMRKQ